MNCAVFFVSTCPTCKCEQPQDGFTVRDLVRLLKGGFPIEAYCAFCDDYWPVSIHQRVALREVVAFTSEGAALLDQGCRPAAQHTLQ
jgi:hypothetical protein